MSLYSIHHYQSEVEKIIHFGGTKKETAIRNAFYNLLNEYAKQKGLMIVTEVTIKATNSNKNVTPDGTLKDVLRQDWGYWESKDADDKIDDEIKNKFDKGYPNENILFEDSQTAILFQNGIETMRVSMKDAEGLHELVSKFINYERPEVKHFRQAIELFKQDIPKVTAVLRKIIETAEKTNKEYKKLSKRFLRLCHDSINPNVTEDDIREMIIQHILTEDVFNTIFDENQFHRENNIARELEKVIHTFFTGSIRKIALGSVQHYYQAINAAAAGIADHHEKQKFLKVIYETFYRSYNPKAADRLGVVYTPNEIVHFMIKSTDYLLHKHFNKFLEDKGVEILDPATGTGTFITDIIDFISKDKLEYKYKHELHANEVAILPYYISNLNIEFTYTQKMGTYQEFDKLCFVDTLDNLGFNFTGKQISLFTPLSEENSLRIIKQNSRKISVVIGNPPYNANQLNENENNKNREYPEIDKRIRDTFIKYSTAQKTKAYDMYSRFYRWAFDRLQDNGIVAFITNRSFIDTRSFDGFRKIVQDDFNYAYIIDLGGDIRTDSKGINDENVFDIKTGVAIMLLVKIHSKDKKSTCRISYNNLTNIKLKSQKLQWLSESNISEIPFTNIVPDKQNNWIKEDESEYDSFIPLINKSVKAGKSNKAIFKLYSWGNSSNRDEWVYDLDRSLLISKAKYLTKTYSKLIDSNNKSYPNILKWSRDLKLKFNRKLKASFNNNQITTAFWRPFIKVNFYNTKIFNDVLTQNHFDIFGKDLNVKTECIMVMNHPQMQFGVHAVNQMVDAGYGGRATHLIPLFYHDKNGIKIENVTDWGLAQFHKYYKTKKIKKEDIFNYAYAVFNYPKYRTEYELNLKKDLPRIPFYENFFQWSEWGKSLLHLHTNFDKAAPYTLIEETTNNKENPKVKLKANKIKGVIIIDENTQLINVPIAAWDYKIGNRSALEWILDQYKEGNSKDPIISAKFNTYRFSNYKDYVIDLLKRVCTVSLTTINIIEEMENFA